MGYSTVLKEYETKTLTLSTKSIYYNENTHHVFKGCNESRIQKLDDTCSIQTTPSEVTKAKFQYEVVDDCSQFENMNLSNNYYQSSPSICMKRSDIKNKDNGKVNKSRNFLDIEKGDEATIVKRLKMNTRNEKVLILSWSNIESYSLKSGVLLTNCSKQGNAKRQSFTGPSMFNSIIQNNKKGVTSKTIVNKKTAETTKNKTKTNQFSMVKEYNKQTRLNTEDLKIKIANVKLNSPMKKDKPAPIGVKFSAVTVSTPKLTASKVIFPSKFDKFSLNKSSDKKVVVQPTLSTKSAKLTVKYIKGSVERKMSKSVVIRK
jgi:hypothetical protein